jgi:hypothetical protein
VGAVAASVGSVAKFAGLLGCVILIGVGWLTPSRLARREKSSHLSELQCSS